MKGGIILFASGTCLPFHQVAFFKQMPKEPHIIVVEPVCNMTRLGIVCTDEAAAQYVLQHMIDAFALGEGKIDVEALLAEYAGTK